MEQGHGPAVDVWAAATAVCSGVGGAGGLLDALGSTESTC